MQTSAFVDIYNRKIDGNDIPATAIYVGRGSFWGNPFKISQDGYTRLEAVKEYARMILRAPHSIQFTRDKLAGKSLVCYCTPELCHAHVLEIIANAPDEQYALGMLANLFALHGPLTGSRV